MKFGMDAFLVVMVATGYLLAPAMLIWGWVRWTSRRRELGRPFFLSLVGFILSTVSAALAISTIAYAHAIHGFPFYDPVLLRIYRWGFLLSAGGIVLGLTGVSAPNALRWQAPLAGFGMLAYWMVAASSE
jgi:hypothetical protein